MRLARCGPALAVALALSLSGCSLFARYTLAVVADPPAGGSVVVSPAKDRYRGGETVTLTAVAANGYAFHSYEDSQGIELSTQATMELTVEADTTVIAVFWIEGATVRVSPPEAGTVELELLQSARGYFAGDRIRLTATANPGFQFSAWEGDLESGANPVEMDVAGPFTVTAAFLEVYDALARSNSYSGTGSQGFVVETAGRAELTYTLAVGDSPRDVFFIFTNTGESAAAPPEVTQLSPTPAVRPPASPAPRGAAPTRRRPLALRGSPLADAFYAESAALLAASPRVSPRAVVAPPFTDRVGDSAVFFYNSTSSTIPATCREIVARADGHTLSVWVANDQAGTVSGDMVVALADKFLSTEGDRIYDWITGIYGEEWGPDSSTALIGDNDSITILLYDINGDGTGFVSSGGVVGLFWGKDNFTRAQVAYSNERIMFYLDAPMLAYVDTKAGESTWSIGNSWPREVVSTLAHEFQHMIHYYQKDVLRDVASSTVWLNEMCSMMAEDFVSRKLEVPGPRGVDVGVYDDGSAGAAANAEGFFPIFNYNNATPVAYWPGSTAGIETQLASYAAVYAYGAYLGRNFGGAGLFSAIVQNASTGRAAVEQGLAAAGHPEESFGSTLVKWGIASLRSDDIAAEPGYRYNSDGWMESASGGETYHLGSVDLYNYDYEYAAGSVLTGPRIYGSLPVTQAASSSWYYAAASAATGTLVWDIRLEQDTRLSVVVKP